MRKQYTTPISLASYLIIIFGLALLILTHGLVRSAGIVLPILGTSIFCYSRFSLRSAFDRHIEKSLTGDLADIGKHYCKLDVVDEKADGEGVPSRNWRSGFWVAEVVEDAKRPVIVGCVGLGKSYAYSSEDETSAELRRLVISPRYRHKGIGRKLIQTVVHFAREHQIETIYLTTSSYQQPAINLYKKLGFHLEGKREMTIQMQKWKIYAFRLNVNGYSL
ncbi:putative N-acetyltransferase camello [Psilocybe cubensis]|uniref:N-acetyltransferase domain-containing protein n=2 Tax=Psilocybe cubensis TaxID=181762 RepID=A0A8H7Y414_PSICU|nr:putative N-acetyltransferase camello [Psilocybe cubensis]KAH9483480.1 putative N-acetyltransferase camello [Psilocybe cubensis]